MIVARSASAQAADAKPVETYQTIYLSNVTQNNDANEIQTALRNMLPRLRVYYLQPQAALALRGSAEDVQLAQKIVSDLDHAKKTYRLIYTIAETDGGKPTGTEHFALVLSPGAKTGLKQGSRVPIVTGKTNADAAAPQAQIQYIDVGLNIDATLEGSQDGLRLRTRVEESSLSEDKSSAGTPDPVIRQTSLDVTSALAQGKPVLLGSLDVPGSTRHLEISVNAEILK